MTVKNDSFNDAGFLFLLGLLFRVRILMLAP